MKIHLIAITLIALLLTSCREITQHHHTKSGVARFNPDIFTVKGTTNFEKARGQVLYLPFYSNIPYGEKMGDYDLSGFLTIHNTDLRNPLKVSHIYYFNSNGELVKDFLGNDTLALKPLESKSFFIPAKDKSGTGANFLVEWRTNQPVNIPLIETIMLSLKSGQGVSFLSAGKVIEQME
jgi:hypothetical protein